MRYILSLIFLVVLSGISFSQEDTLTVKDTNTYRIIKTDGGEIIGKILSQDEREIYVQTLDNRKMYIPQHVVKEVVLVNPNEFNAKGDFIGEDKFATRYFLTTNGLPIKKGEHYVQWNLFGPDFQFAVADNFGLGIMTSWIGMPLIGTAKYSFEVGPKTQIAVGGLLGTGSWIAPDWGGALPFATVSFGDRTKNIAFSGGYGSIWSNGDASGRALASVAGMIKVGPNVSLVFDSFILLPGKTTYENYTYDQYNASTGTYETVTYTTERRKPGFALLIPGVRWHQEEGKAIQFGFTGVMTGGEVFPVPIPMVQWYRTL